MALSFTGPTVVLKVEIVDADKKSCINLIFARRWLRKEKG